jgi:hypothetical protein
LSTQKLSSEVNSAARTLSSPPATSRRGRAPHAQRGRKGTDEEGGTKNGRHVRESRGATPRVGPPHPLAVSTHSRPLVCAQAQVHRLPLQRPPPWDRGAHCHPDQVPLGAAAAPQRVAPGVTSGPTGCRVSDRSPSKLPTIVI